MGLLFLSLCLPIVAQADTETISGATETVGMASNKITAERKELLAESNIKLSNNKQTNYAYVIQVGSFRNKKDAEILQAKIVFKGIKSNIKAITSKSGQAWYRVMAGSYNNRSKMNDVLDKLVSINIQPLVKKVKK
jgi:cell division protein FtsN